MKMFLLMATAAIAPLAAQTKAQTPVPAPASESRIEIAAALTNDVASMAISPDGRKLAFVGLSEGRNRLWVQTLDSSVARPLPGTEDASFPFWSADSQSIGFFGDNKLQRLDLETGSTRTLVTGATWPAGGTWNRDGTILYARHGQFVIWRTPDTGGASLPVTQVQEPQQQVHIHPQFLPDGRHFLYYVQGTAAARGIYVGQLDSRETRRLVDSEAAGVYAAGRLLFRKGGTLFAQEFDAVRLTLSGSPTALAEQVPIGGRSVAAMTSAAGHIAYRTGLEGSVRQLTWFDRAGKQLSTVGQPVLTGQAAPSISPDGNSVLLHVLVEGNGDLWTADLRSGSFTPFTSDISNDSYPAWSFDGSRIVFSSNRTNSYEMYEKPVGMVATRETLLYGLRGSFRHPMDWSRDGRYLLYRTGFPDLWALQLDGLREVPIIPAGPAEIRWPQFSPDGKWIAFQSNATGRNEIYIHGPFEPPSMGQTSTRLSVDGGAWVRWRGDGKELFYARPDGTLMAIPIDFDSNGRNFKAGKPVALFTAPMAGGPDNNSVAQQYMVSKDGQRFLVLAAPPVKSPIKVILNWKP
jgi:Tol biopolymer transport system component